MIDREIKCNLFTIPPVVNHRVGHILETNIQHTLKTRKGLNEQIIQYNYLMRKQNIYTERNGRHKGRRAIYKL